MDSLILTNHVRAFNRLYTQAIGSLDDNHEGLSITLGESRLLFTISTLNDPLVSQIADVMSLDLAYTSRLLGTLEDAHLVSRTISPGDRRQRVVSLTSSGTKLLAEIEERSNERVLAMFQHLDSNNLQRLLAAMDTISALLPTQDDHDRSN